MLALPVTASAHHHFHHHSYSSSGSSHSSGDIEMECVRWERVDAGVDAGVTDCGCPDPAAATDAGSSDGGDPNLVCVETAPKMGCSAAGLGGPSVVLAALALVALRRGKRFSGSPVRA